MLAFIDMFLMHNSVHVPYVHVQLRLGVNFSISAIAAFEDIFSLRGLVGLGNDIF